MPKRTRTTRRLEVWLKDTDQALFVLNAQRRLVFFNRGCERLTGWTAPDLLGQKCEYVSEADAQSPLALLAALAPPPEAWTGKLERAPVNVPCRTETVPRVIHYFPLVDSEQVVKAMLGIIAQVPSAAPPQPIPATQRLHAELAVLRQSVRRAYGDGNLIGQSPAMRRAFEQVKTAQAATSPVLFVGETGTGRQHLARVIHYHGPHGKQIFVPLDCRSSVDLEQTLARIREDHRADALRVGAVYFNNIDYASSLFQQDLLDWLTQDAASTPVRIFAGSTRPLKPLVDNDQFQRELYFALTSLVIEIPPLRERMDDLESVAQYFVEELNRDAESQVGGFADDVWRQFRRYNWPGNLTELRHVIAESRLQCSGPTIRPEHLPFRFRTGVTAQSMEPAQRPRIVPLDQLLEQVEREQIERAMVEARQNKARAAELLGITRPRLYRRMEQLGIFDPDVESAT